MKEIVGGERRRIHMIVKNCEKILQEIEEKLNIGYPCVRA